MTEVAAFRALYPVEFYEKFLTESIRPDGRDVSATRGVTISAGSISTAYGSSMVKLGNTAVVGGVQAELSFEDLNVSSQLIINLEVGGISGTNFGGKPSTSTQAIASRLRSLVESCNVVKNLNDLYVQEGESKVLWYLIVDLYCLDHDGNLFDACLIALITALKNVRIPEGKIDNGRVVGSLAKTISLDICPEYPISLSFVKFQDYILTDPTNEEEELSDSSISVACSATGNTLHQVYKPGGHSISDEKLRGCIQNARKHAKNVAAMIEEATAP